MSKVGGVFNVMDGSKPSGGAEPRGKILSQTNSRASVRSNNRSDGEVRFVGFELTIKARYSECHLVEFFLLFFPSHRDDVSGRLDGSASFLIKSIQGVVF